MKKSFGCMDTISKTTLCEKSKGEDSQRRKSACSRKYKTPFRIVHVVLAWVTSNTSFGEAFIPYVHVNSFTGPAPSLTNHKLPGFKIAKIAKTLKPARSQKEPTASGEGTATISNEVLNLVKTIVGSGVLSLPAGVAAFGNAPSATIPAAALIAIIGGISAYTFSMIGRVCSFTGAKSYRDAWAETIGPKTCWIAAGTCVLQGLSITLAYSMILADTFQAILATFGIVTVSRTSTLLGVTGSVLLPLCLMKKISSLAPFSLLGIIGMVYTAGAMALRYISGGYKLLPAGKFIPELASNLRPSFGSSGAASVLNPSSFIMIAMLSTAYVAHFNAPIFFKELKNNTMKRFNIVVGMSFALSVAIYIAVTALGFLTFGANSNGLILNNYSNSDILMSFSRIAVATSLIFSYPLTFLGLRDGIFDLANVPVEERTNKLLNKVTVLVLSGITALALTVKDVSFVMSLAGASIGNALIYLYPVLMFRNAVKKRGEAASKQLKAEAGVSLGVAGLGVVMGGIGAKMALKTL
mmetsp:Transcript_2144/g.2465  ORF Transcript_2144/g.2465 Transcript_2144/m.2465 type:complete len:524 (+) Transcript_2144:317-1888(+)|eukprot:CAMPEP_0194388728 /NCGR_PEP_ID=MMETSP0174-20130528/100092_1 /TAXON_ID=216777 /ORGANISM="Proboscia alata, Strain PI-D3" /LENGTH=523 /DNA_ID=CAMNT_0039180285 /DNA_START=295 /DNA_END=1866 /DNA_ORIENTATION=+